jgi:hypothetical protein
VSIVWGGHSVRQPEDRLRPRLYSWARVEACPQSIRRIRPTWGKISLTVPHGLKPVAERKALVAALKALRYPKSNFFREL